MFSAKEVRDRALPTPCRQGYKPNYIVSVCRWLLSGSNKSCTSHVCSLSESTSTLVYLVLLYEQRVTSETMHQARRSLIQVARCVYAGIEGSVEGVLFRQAAMPEVHRSQVHIGLAVSSPCTVYTTRSMLPC